MAPSLQEEIAALRARFAAGSAPDARLLIPLADALRRSGETGEALEIALRFQAEFPDLSSGHYVTGCIHRDRGEPDDARAAFERVLVLDPEHAFAREGLADLPPSDSAPSSASPAPRSAPDPESGGGSGDAGGAVGEAEVEGPPQEGRDAPERDVNPGAAGPEAAGPEVREAPAAQGGEMPAPSPESRDPDHGLPDADPTWFLEPWPGAEEDPGPGPEPEDGWVTRTLGDLYAAQGLTDRAIEVFEALLLADPSDAGLLERLSRLRGGPDAAEGDREVNRESEAAGTDPEAERVRTRPQVEPEPSGGRVRTGEEGEADEDEFLRWLDGLTP